VGINLVKLGLNVLVGRADPCVNRSLLHRDASFRLKVSLGSTESSYPISGRFGGWQNQEQHEETKEKRKPRTSPRPLAVQVGHLDFPFRNYLLDGITMAWHGAHSPQGVLRPTVESLFAEAAVPYPIAQLRAIWRWPSPNSNRRRRTSFSFRMDNLFVGNLGPSACD
jgi:hypothetical protein